MSVNWPRLPFAEFLRPNSRPYTLGAEEDANLVGMRWYGKGPFHRELKTALQITKKTHFVIEAGDVIYNKLFAWKGAFGVVPPELGGMFVSDKFPTYELDRSKVDARFLEWYFWHPSVWEEARAMSTGSAAFSKLTLNPPKFLLLTMPTPSLDGQRRIVAQIEELAGRIQEACGLRKQASNAIGALVRSELHRVTNEVKLTGILSDVLSGKPRNGWSAKCDNAEDGVAVLSLGSVTGFRYRSTEVKRTSLHAANDGHFWLHPGDLLITRSNTPEFVGHAAIYSGEPCPCIYPDLMMRLVINEQKVDTRFVWYWLQSPAVREYVARHAKGTSPTMKKLTQGIVMAIPYPTSLTLPDQRRIVATLDVLQSEANSLMQLQAKTAAELDALLPAILDRAFRGEL